MNDRQKLDELTLLDEPIFSLAFGQSVEDFTLLWSLTEGVPFQHVDALREVEPSIKEVCPTLSGLSTPDAEGEQHILSIVSLDMKDIGAVRTFISYFSSILKESEEKEYGTPWFLLFYSLEGRSQEFRFLSGGNGPRAINARIMGDEENLFSLRFAFMQVDLTAPTLKDNWHPLSFDLLESDPERIRIPELREKLAYLKQEEGMETLLENWKKRNASWRDDVVKRLVELGFSKEEVEEMMED